MSTTEENIDNVPPNLEMNEAAYFTTKYYPQDYPFKVQRVDNGWLLTIPNLVKQFLDVEERVISYSTDCFLQESFFSDWETLIGNVEYYITQYGYEDAPGYPVANDNIWRSV